MKTVKLFVLAAVLAVSPACKKKNQAEPKNGSGEMMGSGSAGSGSAGSGSAAAGSGSAGSGSGMAAGSGSDSGSGSAAAPAEDTADWIKVYATHSAPNPNDPVEVKFEKFKVVKASFDPKKIEGGTATLEVDVASLKTNDPKRDQHLATPDYLDVGKFATATIDIANVKKKDDKSYTADATVKLHGVEKKFPVTFEVVEAKDDSIRIKAEHKFDRRDFKIGRDPNPDRTKGDSVSAELTFKAQLTLKKT